MRRSLLSFLTILAFALLSCQKDDAHLVPRLSIPLLNTTHYINPKDPPGFSLAIDIAESGPFAIPERVYLASIATVYTWALDGWEHVIPNGTPLLFVELYGAEFASGTMVQSEQDRQLQVKYLVLAMIHLMAQMAQKRMWSKSVAAALMYQKPIGFVKLGRPSAARNGISISKKRRDAATIGIHLSSHDTETQPLALGASKWFKDPKDHDFVIEYQTKDQRLLCVDFLSTVLYAIATAAQGSEDDYCRDLGGWNEKRTAIYRIHGLPPGPSTTTLTYGIVRRGLSLLSSTLYDQRSCEREVTWRFSYRERVVGYGSISASDSTDFWNF